MKTLLYLILAIALLGLQGCGHDSPTSRGIESPLPGGDAPGGNRPGLDPTTDLNRELADDIWRLTGPGVSMRYDRGGMLFTSMPDGTVKIIDLDGSSTAEILPGTEGAEGCMSGTKLTVNGKEIALTSMRKLKQGKERIWLTATDADEHQWIMVIP